MKKLISFSFFVLIIVLSLFAKTTQAESNPIRRSMVVMPACKTGAHGHWKWNRRMHTYIWIEGRANRRGFMHRGYQTRNNRHKIAGRVF